MMLRLVNVFPCIMLYSLMVALAEGDSRGACQEDESPSYLYWICDFNLQFNASRAYCNEHFKADLVTYPDEDEYKRILDMLKKYEHGKGLPYYDHFLGVYQAMGSNRLVAYSGDFYWVNDTGVKITSNSSSYWKPIEQWITGFNNLSTSLKSRQTFTVRDGVHLSGDVFNTGYPMNASVLCQRKIDAPTPYIGLIVGLCLFGFVLLIFILLCVFYKKKKLWFKTWRCDRKREHCVCCWMFKRIDPTDTQAEERTQFQKTNESNAQKEIEIKETTKYAAPKVGVKSATHYDSH